MISFELNQTIVPKQARLSLFLIKRILKAVEKQLPLGGHHTLSIAFVNHRVMRRLNRTYRGRDRVTDILSFSGVGDKGLLGELILAWPHVRDQAKREGKTLKDELALLIVHGTLHLLGHDHETLAEAKRMFLLQEKVLKKFSATRKTNG